MSSRTRRETGSANTAEDGSEAVLAFPRTFALRRQHTEIMALSEELKALLDAEQLASDGSRARAVIAALSGKLTVHLAMEDRFLYPRLANSDDAAVKKLSEQFVAEMGGLANAFVAYLARWREPKAIESNASGFISATRPFLSSLGRRIERENRELYPLLDRS